MKFLVWRRQSIALFANAVIGCAATLLLLLPHLARADVFVLANRTPRPLDTLISPATSEPYQLRLKVGEVRPLFADDPLHVAFNSSGERRGYLLRANTPYYFGQNASGVIDLHEIGLGAAEAAEGAETGRVLPGDARFMPVAEIPVMILVDEDEPSLPAVWQARLRARVERASVVLQRHAGVRLRVARYGRWRTDNRENDFMKSFANFERDVKPPPGVIAIGFASQYQLPVGRTHLGGTRGPLNSHLMIREWSQHVSEPERLELLLHELGHHLGASHSAEMDSVMRPLLGDRRSRLTSFQIRFDPVNTLIMSMVGEEIRRRDISSFTELTPATSRRLADAYGALGSGLSDDPAAKNFLRRVKNRAAGRAAPARVPNRGPGGLALNPVADKAPAVAPPRAAERLRAEGRAAVAAAPAFDKPLEPVGQPGKASTLGEAIDIVLRTIAAASGDPRLRAAEPEQRTELLVRAAARTAAELPDETEREAFVYALALAMDDTGQLAKRGGLVAADRSATPKLTRAALAAVKPTVRGRVDLAKHFFVSAGLALRAGDEQARAIGLAKELVDSQGGTGFSFADLAADRAGVRFGREVAEGRVAMASLAAGFRPADYCPAVDGLQEGLTLQDVIGRYGGQGDPRFDAELAGIDGRIDRLTPYLSIGFDED
ncbi:hypothetical protein Mal64_32830 [Pseudobythopirellula maris]|uniref:Matrixin n=1 Tax=Pseudobythopirellula maris TaxID=2527991 RepID=A0A5C5ZKI5_9BACT|nr:hypothetical protein [Pseudobythopirellula maris]TWT87740.1 hypothetical protein Mal64_32830 [Pseudobythopirellula maris]